MLQRFLLALVAVLCFGMGGADAGMDLKQGSDGGADWVHKPSKRTYTIGRQILSVRITDISTASSEYVYVPEAGIITAVHCTLAGAITVGDATISVADGSSVAFTTITVATSGSAAGDIDSSTGLSESIDAGSFVTVGTGGESTGTVPERCLVIIDSN